MVVMGMMVCGCLFDVRMVKLMTLAIIILDTITV